MGTGYRSTVAATGTAGTITYSVSSGSLPAGLVLDATTGVISGTPTVSGSAAFTLGATDAYGTGTQSFQVLVRTAPSITTTALPDGAAGGAYSGAVAATGSGTIGFAVTGGAVPAGLTFDATTGVLSGIPTSPGSSTFTITATSAYGSASATYRIAVFTTPTIVTATLPAPRAGTSFSVSIATTGSGPITYSMSGSVPSGVRLDSASGVVAGTPKTAGTYRFSVTATSPYGSMTQRFTLVVAKAAAAAPKSFTVTVPHFAKHHRANIAGSTVRIKATKLGKHEQYTIKIGSKVVATGKATANGTVNRVVRIPAKFGKGKRTVLVIGAKVKGKPQLRGTSWIHTRAKPNT